MSTMSAPHQLSIEDARDLTSQEVVITKDRQAIAHAKRLFLGISNTINLGKDVSILPSLIDMVFSDETIKNDFKGAVIRYQTMCGEVIRALLEMHGRDPDIVTILAIGSVNLSEENRDVSRQLLASAYDIHRTLIDRDGLGYDLAAQGDMATATSAIRCFDAHYGFSRVDGLVDKLIGNFTVEAGGMRGIDDIFTSFVLSSMLVAKQNRSSLARLADFAGGVNNTVVSDSLRKLVKFYESYHKVGTIDSDALGDFSELCAAVSEIQKSFDTKLAVHLSSLLEELTGINSAADIPPSLCTAFSLEEIIKLRSVCRDFINGEIPCEVRSQVYKPDNSFGTANALADLRTAYGAVADVDAPIHTEQKNLLHLSPEKVREVYMNRKPDSKFVAHDDVWYITPVGNPSGTAALPAQLAQTCAEIVRINPKAKIVLDCVYLRTLPEADARELMAGIISNSVVLDRVVFIESFSKTDGWCGERVGAIFTSNDVLFKIIQNIIMMTSAGNGRFKDAIIQALTNKTPEQMQAMLDLHKSWRSERVGLYNRLIKSGEFTDLFDSDQTHITDNQLNMPLGLYLLLKLKPGVKFKDVLSRTGCNGSECKLGDDNYIRFALGTLTKPTFAKNVDS